jgi:hypothetical protein
VGSLPVTSANQAQLSIKNRLFLKEDELQQLLLNRYRPQAKLSIENLRRNLPVFRVT